MRALTRRVHDECGASAVVVALVIVLLFGFTALALDVAALVQERRELQNGADAAALAVAKDCAAGTSCGAYLTTADNYADANADDGQSNVDEVCGNGPGLTGCADPPTLPTGTQGYVRAVTSTNEVSSPDNPDQVNYRFAPVLSDAFVGKTMHGSAVAAWGSPGSASVLPLTMSLCEYNLATSNGTTYATPVAGNPPYSGNFRVIKFHTGNARAQAADCAAQAGQDTDGNARLPGGFGWLQTLANCEVEVDVNGWYDEKPGAAAPGSSTGCDPSLFLNKVVLIPVFDDVNGLGGTNGEYHLEGFAAFYITGFRLSGGAWTVNPPCSPPADCIGGYFVQHVAVGEDFGGPSMGAVIVKMVG
jgi:Flp pilus assembly protein TadG